MVFNELGSICACTVRGWTLNLTIHGSSMLRW